MGLAFLPAVFTLARKSKFGPAILVVLDENSEEKIGR